MLYDIVYGHPLDELLCAGLAAVGKDVMWLNTADHSIYRCNQDGSTNKYYTLPRQLAVTDFVGVQDSGMYTCVGWAEGCNCVWGVWCVWVYVSYVGGSFVGIFKSVVWL